jgi:hypothetical protein
VNRGVAQVFVTTAWLCHLKTPVFAGAGLTYNLKNLSLVSSRKTAGVAAQQRMCSASQRHDMHATKCDCACHICARVCRHSHTNVQRPPPAAWQAVLAEVIWKVSTWSSWFLHGQLARGSHIDHVLCLRYEVLEEVGQVRPVGEARDECLYVGENGVDEFFDAKRLRARCTEAPRVGQVPINGCRGAQ